MEARISIQRADPYGETATELMRQMTVEVSQLYDLSTESSGSFNPADMVVPRSAFVIASLDGKPVGCGALRPMDEHDFAEIKRMFVVASARRLGIGRRILAELERLADEFGYEFLRLETGNRQPAAISLYEGHGFYRIQPFGKYIDDPISICFEKMVQH